ncbi:hypothetical protein HU200_007363 [Digitaria exilis]|uniref:Legume lectin domain-containing protein n=1 Tax=Digitaria exilis TaxID=1010633 RepID=A0A835KR68_9POAL|nr:hypothetical protein HU200_007363 [Digitaria exilis]
MAATNSILLHLPVLILLLVMVLCRSGSADDDDVDFIYQGFQHASGSDLGPWPAPHRCCTAARSGSPTTATASSATRSTAPPCASSAAGGCPRSARPSSSTSSPSGAAAAGHDLAFVVSPSTALPGASPENYLGVLGPTTNGKASNHVLAV